MPDSKSLRGLCALLDRNEHTCLLPESRNILGWIPLLAGASIPPHARLAGMPKGLALLLAGVSSALTMRVKNHIWILYGVLALAIPWLVWLSITLNKANQTLSDIDDLAAPLRLQQAAEEPGKPRNQTLATKILKQAIRIPQHVLERTGKSFIDAASHETKAWGAALDFVNYRSSRTILPLDITAITASGDEVTLHYNAGPLQPAKLAPYVQGLAKGFGTSNVGARWESIGENMDQEGGIPALLARDGAVNLDGRDIRNVIFKGVEIHYSGNNLILENVVFVRCRFIMDNKESCRDLAGRILASSDAVSFQASGTESIPNLLEDLKTTDQ